MLRLQSTKWGHFKMQVIGNINCNGQSESEQENGRADRQPFSLSKELDGSLSLSWALALTISLLGCQAHGSQVTDK